jgi:hypothetical protein
MRNWRYWAPAFGAGGFLLYAGWKLIRYGSSALQTGEFAGTLIAFVVVVLVLSATSKR